MAASRSRQAARFAILAAACWLGPGCSRRPMLRQAGGDAHSSWTTLARGDTLVFEVRSSTGIGKAEFEGRLQSPFRHLRLQLHLRGLESLRFAYGDKVVAVAVASPAPGGIREEASSVGGGWVTLGPESPEWLSVRLVTAGGAPGAIPLLDGWIEVDAPPSYLESGGGPFRIEWVDFYR